MNLKYVLVFLGAMAHLSAESSKDAFPVSPLKESSLEESSLKDNQSSSIEDVRSASIEDILSTIQNTHPEISASVAESKSADKSARASSYVYPDPEIMISQGSGSMKENAFFPDYQLQKDSVREREVRISQEIPFPGKLTFQAQANEAKAGLVQAKSILDMNRIIGEYLNLFNELQLIDQQVSIYAEYIRNLQLLENLSRRNYSSGRGLLAEIKMVGAEKLSAQETMLRLRAEKVAAGHRISYYTPRKANTKSYDEFLGRLLDRVTSFQMTEDQLNRLPQVRYWSFSVEEKNSERKRLYLDYTPDLSVFGGYKRRSTSGQYSMISKGKESMATLGVTVRVPLWSFFGNTQMLEANSEGGRMADLSENAVRLKVKSEILALIEEIKVSKERIHAHNHEISPISNQGAQAAMNAYRSGNSSIDLVLSALNRNLMHQLDELQVEWESNNLIIQAGQITNLLLHKKAENE